MFQLSKVEVCHHVVVSWRLLKQYFSSIFFFFALLSIVAVCHEDYLLLYHALSETHRCQACYQQSYNHQLLRHHPAWTCFIWLVCHYLLRFWQFISILRILKFTFWQVWLTKLEPVIISCHHYREMGKEEFKLLFIPNEFCEFSPLSFKQLSFILNP